MLNTKLIKIDTFATLGEELIAIGSRRRPVFENGTRVPDKFDGYVLEVVSKKLGYEKINIYVPDIKFILEEPKEVKFQDLILSLSQFNGQILLKGTASKVDLCNETNSSINVRINK